MSGIDSGSLAGLSAQPVNSGAPAVSLVVAMYNEAGHIRTCLDSLVSQDYPGDKIEILVVDGNSTDSSREVVRSYQKNHPNVRLLDNPRRITPVAFNVGIAAASGDYIGIISAHSVLAGDYVRECVRHLGQTGADHVGGLMTAVGVGRVAQAIAESTNSPFAVGGSRFHYDKRDQYVESVYMGLYRREVFDRIGLFDEELVRNQDDEFNYRLHAAKGRHFQTASVKSVYYSRANYRSLWRQYYQYGLFKPLVFRKVPGSMRWRHVIPSVFLLTILVCIIFALLDSRGLFLLGASVGPYVLAMSIGAGLTAYRLGAWAFPFSFAAFPVMHLAYGAGMIQGLFRASR